MLPSRSGLPELVEGISPCFTGTALGYEATASASGLYEWIDFDAFRLSASLAIKDLVSFFFDRIFWTASSSSLLENQKKRKCLSVKTLESCKQKIYILVIIHQSVAVSK